MIWEIFNVTIATEARRHQISASKHIVAVSCKMRLIIRDAITALPPGSPASIPDESAHAPETLDGALLLSTAPATANQIGTNYETGEPVRISYFAIACYPKTSREFYLFGVSATHDVVSDFDFDSPEDAAAVALASGFVTRKFQTNNA